MKIVYKLPQFLAVVVCALIGCAIYPYIQLAKSTDIFDIFKYEAAIEKSIDTILGMDPYTVLMMVGLLFAIILAVMRRNLVDIKIWIAIVIAIVFFLQAYFGAKLLYGMEQVLTDMSWSSFDMGGQSLYGTIPVTIVYIFILAKLLKKEFTQLLDYIAPLWLTLLIFVRSGCFIVGCCGADACSIGGVEMVLPVQLIEVLLDLIILQIIFNKEEKNLKEGTGYHIEGKLFLIMIGCYGIYRYFLEFIRNNPDVLLGMTYGQVYSIICVLIVMIISLKSRKRNRIEV